METATEFSASGKQGRFTCENLLHRRHSGNLLSIDEDRLYDTSDVLGKVHDLTADRQLFHRRQWLDIMS